MDKSVKDKVVVITGAARGIGYEIADSFIKNGANITLMLDLNEHDGREAEKNLTTKYGKKKAVFLKCDITKDLDTMYKVIIDTYKTVDVLVNNAGILYESEWKKCMDVNATYLFGWTLKFWEHMRIDKGGKGGTIVNMASIAGFRIIPFTPIYQASKFAVVGFTRAIGNLKMYEKTGVRIVAICPGLTRTKLVEDPAKIVDPTLPEYLNAFMEASAWQDVNVMGPGALEVFQQAESGSVWVVEGGKVNLQIFEDYSVL